jgi:imidazolonepropionase-like amidohydrolase
MNSTEISLSDEELLPLMAKHATKLLDAGVTTARDLGCRGMTGITIRDKISKHEIPGPRLQCANAPLTVPGGHACSMGGECSGVEGCREEVRRRKAEGADLVKVMSTGGFMTAGSKVWEGRYSQEEMDALADEAHKSGMPITTHAVGTEGIERAVNAKFDCIEHCAWLAKNRKTKFDEKIAQRMVENGIAVCPTVLSPRNPDGLTAGYRILFQGLSDNEQNR